MKPNHGAFAALVWVIAGVLLFHTEPEAQALSWQALVYFFIGMFVAAYVMGNLSFFAVRGLTEALVRTRIVTQPTRRAAIGLTVAGYVMFAGQALLIYFLARWTIRQIF
jgi:amino acid transporter